MLRSLLACVGARSPRDPGRAEEKGERRSRFGRRRKTVGGVDEGDSRSSSKSTFGCLRKRREKVARSAQLDEDLCDANVEVCSLKAESTEALKVVTQVQLHADVSFPTESLEVIDRVHCPAVSIEPSVVDWDAKITAAREKFQASSARVREAVRKFDQRLIDPLYKNKQTCILQPCHTQQKVAQEPMLPLEHTTLSTEQHKVASCVLSTGVLTEAAQELIERVEFASVSVDAARPVTLAGAPDPVSVPVTTPEESVTVSEQQVSDWNVGLDAADQSFKKFDQPPWPAEEETWKGQNQNWNANAGAEEEHLTEPMPEMNQNSNAIASEAVARNLYFQRYRKHLDTEEFLPSERLETIWSRYGADQAVQSSDQHLTEPMSEMNRSSNAAAGAADQSVRRLKLIDDYFAGKEDWSTLCPLLWTASSEAVEQNLDLHVHHEQVDPEEFLPSERLEHTTLSTEQHKVASCVLSTGVLTEAAQELIERVEFASVSAHADQAVQSSDQHLTEPMSETNQSSNAIAGAADESVQGHQSLKLFDYFWTAGKELWSRVWGATSSEAVEQNQDLQIVCHEQLDPEEFLPSEPVEETDTVCSVSLAMEEIDTIRSVSLAMEETDTVRSVSLAVSVQPDAVDWDEKFAAARQKLRASGARQKLRASSACLREAMDEFDLV